jgi:integral membrane protein (TIGR01906 family)
LKSNPSKFFAIFIALLLPFIILMGGVRTLISFNSPGFQYGLIGFPEDSLGYTRQERTRLAEATMTFLNSNQGIESLMQLNDSKGQTVYTPSEIAHLQDVKNVIQLASMAWFVVCGFSIAFLIWMLVTKSWTQIRHSFFWGAVLNILLMIAVVAFMILSFNTLFEKFHAIFFPQGNWTFSATSGLIRLFPLPLWVNAFIFMVVYALLVSILLLVIFWPRRRVSNVSERLVPTAIPSSKPTTNIPSMATPVNPFLTEEKKEVDFIAPKVETEIPDPIIGLYPPEGGTGLPGSTDQNPKP